MLYLDCRNRVIAFEETFSGTVDGTTVHPRADAHGVNPLTSQPRFSNSVRVRWKIVGQAGTISADETRDQVKTLVASIRNGSNDC